jgi:hypothetical protein
MPNRFNSFIADAHTTGTLPADNIDSIFAVTPYLTSQAIAVKEGYVALTCVTAGAYTLALPTTGLPSAGGNDGQELWIKNESVEAHVITATLLGFNGTLHVATFAGAAGTEFLHLIAHGATWQTLGMSGVTLS